MWSWLDCVSRVDGHVVLVGHKVQLCLQGICLGCISRAYG